MPSHELIWLSPNCDKRRWAAWLRTRRGVSVSAPDVQAHEPRTSGNARPHLEPRVVWIADAHRDDLERLREVAAILPHVRVIGVIGKGAPPKSRGIEWFAWLSRDSGRAVVEKTVSAAFGSLELQAQRLRAIEDLARTEREMEQLHEIGI